MVNEKSSDLPQPGGVPPHVEPPRRRSRGNYIFWLCALYSLLRLPYTWRVIFPSQRPIPGPINWAPCGTNYECGTLDVPLNYHNVSEGTATLAVGRYLATGKTRLGSIFVNPGGPGGSGLSFLYRAGAKISESVDGAYDIVSWDPRGINNTTPRIECFPDKISSDIYSIANDESLEWLNLTDTTESNIIRAQLQAQYAKDEALVQICEERTGDALRHVGTATVVRDMEFFASELEGKDTPINYWGFSYGTVVGAYFVNMFPDRVGRVAIDGVVNPDYWASIPSYKWGSDDYEDTEHAFRIFLDACIESGPKRCALADKAQTASELGDQIWGLIEKLYLHPLAVPHAERAGILGSAHIRDIIFTSMYRPREWPKLAELLNATLSGDGVPLLNELQPTVNFTRDAGKPPPTNMAIWAVQCVDGPPLDSSKGTDAVIDELINAGVTTYKQTSKMFAGVELSSTCFHWKPREAERYTGPWNSTLANDILVIGNIADPITPLINARSVNDMLSSSSRLVIQNGPGHCSLALVSLCMVKTVREYFLDGVLPPNGKTCNVTEVLFPATNATSSDDMSMNIWGAQNAEEVRLLSIFKQLGEAVQEDTRLFKRGF